MAFYAVGPESDVLQKEVGPVTAFSLTRVNQRNGYDTATGKFTAPESGWYEFRFQALARQVGARGEVGITFYKNGVDVNAGSDQCLASTTVVQTHEHDLLTVGRIMQLELGDEVQAYVCSATSQYDVHLGFNLAYFSGKLII